MVSKEEQIITEKIFVLNISLRFLKQGIRPIHNEAIKLIEQQINKLKNTKPCQNQHHTKT
jgi:hypothetical protein